MKRRTFLAATSLALAGSLARVPPVAARGPRHYHVVIVGAGPAGCIVARRLVDRFPGLSIALLEAGGPTSVTVGGRDFPPYDQTATIFDVPGEYQNIPFTLKGEPYRQRETLFTYQGTGYGGNSQFNGMLFQAAPAFDFATAWPAGWSHADLEPYVDRLFAELHISQVPSTDGVFYNAGASQITGKLYLDAGFAELDMSRLGGLGPSYFGRASVVSAQGERGGPVRTHLTAIVGPYGRSTRRTFDIIPFASASRIEFHPDDPHQAVGVTYVDRAAGDAARFVPLLPGGLVVLAAGGLMTPRLLLLSGVGPVARHDEIFSGSFSVPFHIDNPHVGVSLFDHVGTLLGYEYRGTTPAFRAYHYSDYAANAADLTRYAGLRAGPYAQYGPVSVMHETLTVPPAAAPLQPNVEVFVNPFGAGAPGGPYNGPNNFAAFAMLLRPRARTVLKINSQTFIDSPPIYLTDREDADLMATAIQGLFRLYRANPDLVLTFGPGGRSHPTLNPDSFDDVRAYVLGSNPVDGVFYTGLTINHWGGTCPIGSAVDPETLRVDGTRNIHVVDASLHPAPLSAHPVATIMAVGEKASDVLAGVIAGG
jgi:cellobiose dehydrogenase (acceptor)